MTYAFRNSRNIDALKLIYSLVHYCEKPLIDKIVIDFSLFEPLITVLDDTIACHPVDDSYMHLILQLTHHIVSLSQQYKDLFY